jgi:hypothetical protein
MKIIHISNTGVHNFYDFASYDSKTTNYTTAVDIIGDPGKINHEYNMFDCSKCKYYNVNDKIYIDDTIGEIKQKIGKCIKNISIDELYLFSYNKIIFNDEFIFNELSQGNVTIKESNFSALLRNIVYPKINDNALNIFKNKKVYTFSDVQKLLFNEKEIIIKVPIGVTFTDIGKFSIVHCPFDFIEDQYAGIIKYNKKYMSIITRYY